uniref:DREV methyltransferase n=1 Tax=Parascaris univalens TaxID=6257 RepID=A0A914ZNV8_PARUN
HRIAQMLLAKEESDYRLLLSDKSDWYLINHENVSRSMNEKWHQFFLDREAESFLEKSFKTSNAICLQLYYAFASAILSLVLTKTSINGILGRGGMFIFSTDQFREFMQMPSNWNEFDKYMLDVGAGDGGVTSVLAQFYKNVAVTEASKIMEWRLAQRGFRVLPLDKWTNISGPLHLVSVLNLLDRHFDPVALLHDLYRLTSRKNALLLIAVVLPIRQYVEFHPNRKTTNADSKINVTGETLEEQASSLVQQFFIPGGFELIRWGKLPYLCEGDQNRAYYKLDDAVFLLRPDLNRPHGTYNVQEDIVSQLDINSRPIHEL